MGQYSKSLFQMQELWMQCGGLSPEMTSPKQGVLVSLTGGGRGIKNHENLADVICTCPLGQKMIKKVTCLQDVHQWPALQLEEILATSDSSLMISWVRILVRCNLTSNAPILQGVDPLRNGCVTIVSISFLEHECMSYYSHPESWCLVCGNMFPLHVRADLLCATATYGQCKEDIRNLGLALFYSQLSRLQRACWTCRESRARGAKRWGWPTLIWPRSPPTATRATDEHPADLFSRNDDKRGGVKILEIEMMSFVHDLYGTYSYGAHCSYCQ